MIPKSRLKNISSLKYKKHRHEQKLFLIEGYRLCQEALQSDFAVETLLTRPALLSPQKLKNIIQLARPKQVEVIEIQQAEVNRLAATVNSQGIFCVIRQMNHDLELFLKKAYRLIVIIDEGQDPGNVGTIIRACDWFGVDAIVLSNNTVELYNPKVVRATMGSIFHLPIVTELDLKRWLPRMKQLGYYIFGAAVGGASPYHQIDYPRPLILVVGNENRGIRADLNPYLDTTVTIPSHGKAESLNIALAAAIIISRIMH